jgi:hypothetical protein
VYGGAGGGNPGLGVAEGPAPPIEPDHGLQLGDRLVLDRIAIEARLAEPLEAFSAPIKAPVGSHRPTITARQGAENPKLLGLPVQLTCPILAQAPLESRRI